jgi:hypothetical protein
LYFPPKLESLELDNPAEKSSSEKIANLRTERFEFGARHWPISGIVRHQLEAIMFQAFKLVLNHCIFSLEQKKPSSTLFLYFSKSDSDACSFPIVNIYLPFYLLYASLSCYFSMCLSFHSGSFGKCRMQHKTRISQLIRGRCTPN